MPNAPRRSPADLADVAALLLTLPKWHAFAACRSADRAGFYAEPPTAAALATCGRCPVRAACLADALARDEPYGLWGGMTPIQRRKPARKVSA